MKNYLQVVKTPKSIEEIKDIVSDRLIITKNGQMYFDYSSNLRIEISNSSKPYICNNDFSIYSLHQDIELQNTDILEINKFGLKVNVLNIKCNSLIYDKAGNYGIIFDTNNTTSSCKILGIINSDVKNTIIEKLGTNILGDFVVAKYIYGVKLSFEKLNLESGEVQNEDIILSSKNNALVIDTDADNSKQINFDIKISKNPNNCLSIVEDGLLVNNVGNDVVLYKFSTPYDSLINIPEPYDTQLVYLIGNDNPYKMYIYVNDKFICLGDSNISNTDELKAEIMDDIDEHMEINRIE